MIRRKTGSLLLALLFSCAVVLSVSAATLGPSLLARLNGLVDTANVGIVIVSFNTTSGLNETHLNVLRSVGIIKGIRLQKLGMVAVPATAGQVRALALKSAVASLWANDRLQYFDNQARMLTGVERVRVDSGFTARNSGLPVSGAGNFSVVINDSGIDATHPDLQFGSKVIQNVQIVADTETLALRGHRRRDGAAIRRALRGRGAGCEADRHRVGCGAFYPQRAGRFRVVAGKSVRLQHPRHLQFIRLSGRV